VAARQGVRWRRPWRPFRHRHITRHSPFENRGSADALWVHLLDLPACLARLDEVLRLPPPRPDWNF